MLKGMIYQISSSKKCVLMIKVSLFGHFFSLGPIFLSAKIVEGVYLLSESHTGGSVFQIFEPLRGKSEKILISLRVFVDIQVVLIYLKPIKIDLVEFSLLLTNDVKTTITET